MKIPCKFQERKIGSCATFRMSLWRRPDPSQCLADWVEDVWMSEQHRPDDRSRFSNFYTELYFRSRHCLGSFCKTFGRRGNTSGWCQHFRIFWISVRMQKAVIGKTVRMLGQAVQTYTCYGKNYAILEGGRRRPSERGNLPSKRSIARVRICPNLGSL
jgi:hypothetical protein